MLELVLARMGGDPGGYWRWNPGFAVRSAGVLRVGLG